MLWIFHLFAGVAEKTLNCAENWNVKKAMIDQGQRAHALTCTYAHTSAQTHTFNTTERPGSGGAHGISSDLRRVEEEDEEWRRSARGEAHRERKMGSTR